jgi:hypothetical protein
MAWAAASGALASGTVSVVTVAMGGPPPSNDSVQEALVRRIDGVVVKGQWQLGLLVRQGHVATYL